MAEARILIAGIGNIFLGDDGFGVEVIRRLVELSLPAGVAVRDFGIRGFDLALAMTGGPTAVILVDAVARGAEPGTLFVIEPDIAAIERTLPVDPSPHGLHPTAAIRLAQAMTTKLPRLVLIGCEPGRMVADDEFVDGLSAVVKAAVDDAVKLALEQVELLTATVETAHA